jgi:hypothetical protein
MASLPFWDSSDDEEAGAWDQCLLGGYDLPGIVEVEVEPKRKLDVQEGSGSDYDTVADKGQRSADIKVIWQVFEQEQWDACEEIMAVLWPASGKGKPGPLEIVHPKCALFRINAMVIEKINPQGPVDGVLTITLSGYAWGKPKPSPVKVADKAKANAAAPTTADPNSASQQKPFDPNASLLDELVKSLDPKGAAGKPKAAGAPSRDPNLLKP